MEFTFAGISAIVIPFLVNLIKKVPFIGSKFAPIVALLLGVIAGVVGSLTGLLPDGTTIIQAILIGIGIGGASTGLYDVQDKLRATA